MNHIAAVRRMRVGLLAGLAAACIPGTPRVTAVPALPFPADTLRAEPVRPGVTHWFVYAPGGPWAIHALTVDRDACHSALAVKGGDVAVGREKTSTILARLDSTADVVGGVNADFFLFAPPGVPTGAMVSRGRVLTGPSRQPVLAFDSLGTPTITTLRVSGTVAIGAERLEIAGWNRRMPNGAALFDRSWGTATDTASDAIEVVFTGHPSRVALIDTATAGVSIPRDGGVLVMRGPRQAAIRAGDTVRVSVALAPPKPWEAVGGRPVLVRDSAIADGVDTVGGPGFAAGRHPRTAAGIARNGGRLLLVVVDGRQKPYSDGMTLRELATLMLALGARDAINLDGGGSTTMVIADPKASGALRVANRPSDAAGERPVGNALAIVRACARP